MSTAKVIVVKHPPVGDGPAGVALCKVIAEAVAMDASPIVLFHDATEMDEASTEYAKAFMALDRAISSRIVEIVCLIPRPVPRMLAWTVAVVSSKQWHIFKHEAEAMAHLSAAGFALPASTAASPRVQVF